jgi:LPXTG-motif cell wall-anchored protein
MEVKAFREKYETKRGGVSVKKHLVRYLMISVLMLALTGMISSAFAFGTNPYKPNPPKPPKSVAEPATLALVGAGIVGVGVYFYVKRKNKK